MTEYQWAMATFVFIGRVHWKLIKDAGPPKRTRAMKVLLLFVESGAVYCAAWVRRIQYAIAQFNSLGLI